MPPRVVSLEDFISEENRHFVRSHKWCDQRTHQFYAPSGGTQPLFQWKQLSVFRIVWVRRDEITAVACRFMSTLRRDVDMAPGNAVRMWSGDHFRGICMNTSVEQVLDAALALPDGERVEIVEALIASFRPEDQPFDDSWREAILRRSAELRSGQVKPVPWAEVKSGAREQTGG
jgi:putative addiction module component (TIGR02574 family)